MGVLVIANSRAELERLRNQLESIEGLELAGVCVGAQAAISALADTRPDVVVIQLPLPDGDLPALLQRMAELSPGTRSLLLVDDDLARDAVLKALQLGALGVVEADAEPGVLQAAIASVQRGEPYLPAGMSYSLLQSAAGKPESNGSDRREQFVQLAVTLVPLGAALTALLGIMESEYWERLGVRPEDLGLDPTDRLSMLVLTTLLLAGLFGPLLFVGVWQEALCRWLRRKNAGEGSLYGVALKWASGLRGRVLMSVVLLGVTSLLAYFATTVLVVFVGPLVVAVLLINALGLEKYIPVQLDLPRYRPRDVVAVLGVFGLIVATLLGYELLVVGPDLREDGVHNFWSVHMLDIEVFPVAVRVVGEEGEETQALLLGGARGAHVVYDPCRDEAAWLPVVRVELRAIDEVTCD